MEDGTAAPAPPMYANEQEGISLEHGGETGARMVAAAPFLSPGAATVLLIWCLVQLTSLAYGRIRLAERWGISVGWLQLRCRTTLLNRWFLRLGLGLGRLLEPWFAVGSWFGIVALIVAPIMLAVSAFSSTTAIVSSISQSVSGAAGAAMTVTPTMLSPSTTSIAVNATASLLQKNVPNVAFSSGGGGGVHAQLTPLIPGVSVPWSHTWYLVFALLFNGVFHELGHALAAVVEQVRIEACGGFIMAVYPGAFVELHAEQLEQLAPWGRLRVFAAGVWHNAVLAAAALLVLNQMPLLLGSWYNHNVGAGVLAVAHGSSLAGAVGVGDVIVGLDTQCSVAGAASWYGCLSELKTSFDAGHTGMCVPTTTSTALWSYAAGDDVQLVQGFWECCVDASEEGGSKLCFEDLDADDAHADVKLLDGGSAKRKFGCYRARDVASQAGRRCSSATDCGDGMSCLKQTFDSPGSRLLQVQRGAAAESVLFLGSIEELAGSISVTDYSRRSDNPTASMDLPMQVGQFFYYIASIGSALALLNIVPAFALDGEGAVCAVLDLVMEEGTFRNAAKLMVGGAGVLLVGINMLLAVIQLFLLA